MRHDATIAELLADKPRRDMGYTFREYPWRLLKHTG